MMISEVPTLDDLRFRALNNALYHTARRRMLESLMRWGTLVIIVAATASALRIVSALSCGAAGLAMLIIVTAALQLVFDFAGRARTHELLQRRYYDLLGRIEECVKPTDQFRAGIMGEIARISGEEPPTYRVVDAIAYNEAADALMGEAGASHKCKITWWQSLTRHFAHHARASFV